MRNNYNRPPHRLHDGKRHAFKEESSIKVREEKKNGHGNGRWEEHAVGIHGLKPLQAKWKRYGS